MNYISEYIRIKELEELISDLPQGYISEKSINGHLRYYHQWREDGKLKSKYIRKPDLELMREQISKRKLLENELKDLRMKFPKETEVIDLFETNVLVGERLIKHCLKSSTFEKRNCFSELESFLKGNEDSRVCLLFGLRRTGKTTMLRQVIGEMDQKEFNRTAYIQATVKDGFAKLNRDLKRLSSMGYVNIFIDEATLMPDFINSAALLSDVYAAQGMKIVLSGTDSLGFWLANREELYDRTRTIHTTFIPFQEHSRLLGIDDVDEYIRYGGTLKAGELIFDDAINYEDASFRDEESTRVYIDTAICSNIQRSLAYYEEGGHFRNLYSLYNAGELTSAINRIIEDMNHEFVVRVLTRTFKSHDLGSAADLLRNAKNPDERTDLLDNVNKKAIAERLARILDIRDNPNRTVEISDAHVYEIKEYLQALELIQDFPVESIAPGSQIPDYTIFTQPGMRFCQAQALIHSLEKDELFIAEDQAKKDIIINRILNDVRGRMLEDIVLLETSLSNTDKSKYIFQLEFAAGEFDMVIFDKNSKTCEIYEVKHANTIESKQYRHLADEEKIALTEKKYGKVVKKCVLYKGEDTTVNGDIEYRNVEKYLQNLSYPLPKWVTKQSQRSKSLEHLVKDATERISSYSTFKAPKKENHER